MTRKSSTIGKLRIRLAAALRVRGSPSWFPSVCGNRSSRSVDRFSVIRGLYFRSWLVSRFPCVVPDAMRFLSSIFGSTVVSCRGSTRAHIRAHSPPCDYVNGTILCRVRNRRGSWPSHRSGLDTSPWFRALIDHVGLRSVCLILQAREQCTGKISDKKDCQSARNLSPQIINT